MHLPTFLLLAPPPEVLGKAVGQIVGAIIGVAAGVWFVKWLQRGKKRE